MPGRILIAKPGLDGHDRGAKLVARALRDAGLEVIYTGIRQKPATIAAIAVQEDVDLVGLSILSGAHVGLARKTVEELNARHASDIRVIVGGTIPSSDLSKLHDVGIHSVYPTGTPIARLVEDVLSMLESSTTFG